MREAVIVSTARTPIGRAYRGAFNETPAPTLAALALQAAIARAGVAPEEVEDCLLGCSLPQGTQHTIGRMAALRAGLPVEVPGMTLERQCSSGLMTIATAAKQIIVDRMDIVVAGGVESISLAQTEALRIEPDPALVAAHPDVIMPMIEHGRGRGGALWASRASSATRTRCRRSSAPRPRRRRRFDAEIVPARDHEARGQGSGGHASRRALARDEACASTTPRSRDWQR